MLNLKVLRIVRAVATISVAILMLGCPAKRGKQPATIVLGHSVTLTWHASHGAKYYCVYRSTVTRSGYQKIGTSPTPNYKDAPVPAGATFYYVVTAVGDKGESKYSGEIKAVVPK
ncbi:MAG: hypothetical protein ACRD2U_08035 [Terriglobales bacterium]